MKITIRKEVLAAMIDELILSVTPEGIQHSGGPRIFGHWQYGAINPQPEPPGISSMWIAASLAQSIIDQEVERLQHRFSLRESDVEERRIGAAPSMVSLFADDLCGVRPWPWPFPPKYDPKLVRPVDQLAAAAQFQKAAMTKGPLQKTFDDAAGKLFKKGLKGFQRE